MTEATNGGASGPAARTSTERLEILEAISEVALTRLGFEAVARDLLDRLTQALRVDTAAVLLLDEARDELVARAAKGLEEEVEAQARVPLGRGFAGRVAAYRKPIAIPDVSRADIHNPILRNAGVASLLGAPLIVDDHVTGVLHVGSLVPREFTDDDADLLVLVANRIAVAIEHARLVDAEREARASAEGAYAQLARLEAITSTAFAHLRLDELLDALLVRVREVLDADTATVMLTGADRRRLRVYAAVGVDERLEHVEVGAGEGFVGRVMHDARPLTVADTESAGLATDVLRGSGIVSIVGVPLLVGGGVIGVVTVGRRKLRPFADDDVGVLERAAERAATAIEHARLYEAERGARDEAERANARIRRIESLTEVALAHLSLDQELLRTLLTRAREIVSADTAAILMLDAETDELVMEVASGLESEGEPGTRIPVGSGFAGRVAATRVPVAIDQVEHSKLLNPLLTQKSIQSLLGVPLIADDRLLGVLHVGTVAPRRFTTEDTELLQLAAERIALSLAHSRLSEREHRLAAALHRTLLPERLPDVPGVELAARYIPGAQEAIGGDWYDVIRLPRGEVALVIGDVVSRGLRAASATSQIRNSLRAYAIDGDSPRRVLERIDRIVHGLSGREMATLVYIVLDPHTRRYTFASAGHPPPLVVSEDASTELLEGGRSSPLGAVPGTSFREASGELAPGSTLLLYTDGLVERRDMWIDVGLERLAAAARRQANATPDGLCDCVLAELAGGGAPDDVALLAIHPIAIAHEDVTIRLPAEPGSLRALRRGMREWLARAGAADDEAYDLLVAASEAATNAVEHAYGPVDASFEVELALADGSVSVVVRDFGSWRPPRGRNRGRGTTLMTELTDEYELATTDAGTEVRMRRSLARRNGA